MAVVTVATFENFIQEDLVRQLIHEYDSNLPLYRIACAKTCSDLSRHNESEGIFTSIGGRLKSKVSTFQKLYDRVRQSALALLRSGLDPNEFQTICKEARDRISVQYPDPPPFSLEPLRKMQIDTILLERYHKDCQVDGTVISDHYRTILDIAGVRVACKYLWDIRRTVARLREILRLKNYTSDLKARPSGFEDKDYTETPDPETGYRGYHFYVEVPIRAFIPNSSVRLVELQVRTELQDIWARRSHELMYKRYTQIPMDKLEEMKNMSHQLNVADYYLDRLRKEIERLEA